MKLLGGTIIYRYQLEPGEETAKMQIPQHVAYTHESIRRLQQEVIIQVVMDKETGIMTYQIPLGEDAKNLEPLQRFVTIPSLAKMTGLVENTIRRRIKNAARRGEAKTVHRVGKTVFVEKEEGLEIARKDVPKGRPRKKVNV